ncbi:C-X-C chemokine receptor type 1-like [Heterodontus francisci]|uniref:C-X-C chemokine receptor type 1-like n=1 Tax=Heterodontus francisci TaxID=7792 RepID=UPI00355BF72B
MATIVSWNTTVTRSWLEINSTNQTGNASLGPSMDSADTANFLLYLSALPTVLGPLIVLGITGNSVALWHIIRMKQISSPTDVLLLDLTIMNILVILDFTIILLQFALTFIFVKILGHIIAIVNVITLYGNPLFMACIAIDQYIAVVHPIRSHAWRKLRYYVVLSVAAWLALLALSLACFYATEGPSHNNFLCSAQALLWEENLVLMLCPELFAFFIPILVLLACYVLIAKKLIKVGDGKVSMELMKKKVLRTIWAILALLLLCFAPFHITELFFLIKKLLGLSTEITKWKVPMPHTVEAEWLLLFTGGRAPSAER